MDSLFTPLLRQAIFPVDSESRCVLLCCYTMPLVPENTDKWDLHTKSNEKSNLGRVQNSREGQQRRAGKAQVSTFFSLAGVTPSWGKEQ